MALRAILSPLLRRARAVGVALALVWTASSLLSAAGASATVLTIEPSPAQPTSCDSVAVVVKGELPADCYDIYSAVLRGPVSLPTASIVPQYALAVQIVVREPNPQIMGPCSLIPVPYERVLYLPIHPPGQYHAVATEYITPFFTPTPAAATESSRVETTFPVSPDSCKAASCYLLDFQHPVSRLGLCDAGGAPGDTACVEITLGSREPVAGVQSVVRVFDPRVDAIPGVPLSGDILRPVRARAIGRAEGFHVAWTTDESTIKFMLYSNDGAAISEGDGPVLRVCYAIGHDTAPGPYFLRFGKTVVADPAGTEIQACPSFAEVLGRFCVGAPPCDLDGNGRSNVLDIIRLVRCALGGPDSAAVCPDSVRAHADCNDDGAIDIRDVICCVRKMLAFGLGRMDQPKGTNVLGIRFLGPAEYWKPDHANVAIEVDPGADFGAAAVEIEAPPGVRITGISPQDDALMASAFAFQSEAGDGQRSRFMIFRVNDQDVTQPIRAWVHIETDPSLPRGAVLRIVGADGGSWSQASPVTAEITQATAAVTPYAVPAPRVLPARPNPFTSGTDIWYELDSQRQVTVRVYSATGKLVRTLLDASMPRGIARVSWNGRDDRGREVGSGVYFVKVAIPEAESTIRIMRLR